MALACSSVKKKLPLSSILFLLSPINSIKFATSTAFQDLDNNSFLASAVSFDALISLIISSILSTAILKPIKTWALSLSFLSKNWVLLVTTSFLNSVNNYI